MRSQRGSEGGGRATLTFVLLIPSTRFPVHPTRPGVSGIQMEPLHRAGRDGVKTSYNPAR